MLSTTRGPHRVGTRDRLEDRPSPRRAIWRLEAPCQVRLHGKGNKVRLCPISPAVARLLRNLMAEGRLPIGADPADALLFTNARGGPLTRYGVRYLLRKYLAAAVRLAPTLRDKRMHPHSLRHSTAVALLKSGVDFATISQWLGHAGLNTTMRYARADIDLKPWHRPVAGACSSTGAHLVGWLRRG